MRSCCLLAIGGQSSDGKASELTPRFSLPAKPPFAGGQKKMAALYKAKSHISIAPSLEMMVEGYLESVRFRKKSPGTQIREKVAAAPLLFVDERRGGQPRLWAEQPIDILDGLDVQDYIDTRQAETCQRNGKPVSPDSIRLEVRLLRSVFKQARGAEALQTALPRRCAR